MGQPLAIGCNPTAEDGETLINATGSFDGM